MFNLIILDYFGLFSLDSDLVFFGFNFKIWGSETAEGLVMIYFLRDNLDSQGTVN